MGALTLITATCHITSDLTSLSSSDSPFFFFFFLPSTNRTSFEQAEEMFMMHDEAVLCVNFSRDNELLVSGEEDGRGSAEGRA